VTQLTSVYHQYEDKYTDHPCQRDPEDLRLPLTMMESDTVQMQHVWCPIHRHDTAKCLYNTTTTSLFHLPRTTNSKHL